MQKLKTDCLASRHIGQPLSCLFMLKVVSHVALDVHKTFFVIGLTVPIYISTVSCRRIEDLNKGI